MKTRYNTLNAILENPSEISEIIKDPSKFGMDFWNELSNKEKSYIAYAAAAGMMMYGVWLGKQRDEPMQIESKTK